MKMKGKKMKIEEMRMRRWKNGVEEKEEGEGEMRKV